MCSMCREAFAAWIPPFGVPLSYGIAISYVIVDTVDKGAKALQAANIELAANGDLHPEVNRGRCLAGIARLSVQQRPIEECFWPARSCFDWLCVVGDLAALRAQSGCLEWLPGMSCNIIVPCTPCLVPDQALHPRIESSRRAGSHLALQHMPWQGIKQALHYKMTPAGATAES